jgi:hypothetical protein
MMIFGMLVFLALVAAYVAGWIGLLLLLVRLQTRSGLGFFQASRSVRVFAMRVLVSWLAMFPVLGFLLNAPGTFSMNGHAVMNLPALIEDKGVAAGIAAATALLGSVLLWSSLPYWPIRKPRTP